MRVRTTLAATCAAAVVLVVAGVSLVLVQRHLLRDGIVDLAQRQASELAAQVEVQGIRSPELEALVQSEDGVVQVVDPEGRVVAASGSISGSAPIVDVRPSDGETATVFTDGLPGGHDDPFAVVARGVSTPDGTAVVVSAESLESAQEATSTLVSVLAVGIPIVVLIVGGLSYWLTGRALAPVRALRARVAEIHAGDRSARVPVSPAGDEISRLAETMNAMLERLQAASAQQRRFVADASHELRSPLAAIRTAHEIGLAHPESTDWPGTSRDTLTELERLEKLVADLLLLARFDDNEPGTAYTDVDLDDIVSAEVIRLRRRGSPQVEARLEPVRLRADQHQLSRLVRNLVDNATRHATSTVSLVLRNGDGTAVLHVGDDGPGVPEHEAERIFERFVRLDESRGRATGGTGLGLSIAREIARRHGGDVTVTSREGSSTQPTGALFVVRLPVRPPSCQNPDDL